MSSIKQKAFLGMIWMLMERFAAQAIGLIVSIVLARLLTPNDYGTVALAMVFTNFLSPFINCGLGSALIQNKDSDDTDFSTYFYFNIFMCVSLYTALFIAAPWIADFYNDSSLTMVLRVIGLNFLVYGVKGVQQNYVNKNMLFKRFFFSTIGGTLFSAVVGIVLAYLGFGVWAIVLQNLSNNIVDTLILWVTVKWRPRKLFSFNRLKIMISYGWKILAVNITNTIEMELRSLLIGKVYSSKDLAYYNKGLLFPDVVCTCVDSTINSVLFPAFSRVNDSIDQMRNMLRRSIRTGIYIIAPLNIGLAVCSKPLISLLLTDKWLPCVPFMVIACIGMIFVPINTENQNVIKALGRSDIFFKNDCIKKFLGIICLLVGMKLGGIMGIAYSTLVSRFVNMYINSRLNKKLLNYGLLQQLKDCLPGLILAAIMGIPVYCVQFLNLPNIATLVIQVLLGGIIYLLLSVLFRVEDFFFIINTIKKK